jgi:hypothetical protein
MYLNKDVAVRVAATEINAVVAAVVMIVVVGIGTSISVNGISTICASGGKAGVVGCTGLASSLGGSSSVLIPSIPGGGRSVLGGTTSGLYLGNSALGTSSTGGGIKGASGSVRDGNTGGSVQGSTEQTAFDKLHCFVIHSVVSLLS